MGLDVSSSCGVCTRISRAVGTNKLYRNWCSVSVGVAVENEVLLGSKNVYVLVCVCVCVRMQLNDILNISSESVTKLERLHGSVQYAKHNNYESGMELPFKGIK